MSIISPSITELTRTGVEAASIEFEEYTVFRESAVGDSARAWNAVLTYRFRQTVRTLDVADVTKLEMAVNAGRGVIQDLVE